MNPRITPTPEVQISRDYTCSGSLSTTFGAAAQTQMERDISLRAHGRARMHAPLLTALAASLPLGLCAIGGADQILVHDSLTHTTYRPSGMTNVQDVRPLVGQRGVNHDGSLRAGSTHGMRVNGNPFGEGWNRNQLFNGMRLDIGTYMISDVDLSLPAEVPWVIGRSYNTRQEDSGSSAHDSDGYNGVNWFQSSQPELVFYDPENEVSDRIYLVYGADRFAEFARVDLGEESYSTTTFRAVNGAAGAIVIEEEESAPDLATYYDQMGNQFVFFWVGDDDIADAKEGQFWKKVNPAGDVAYVGDASTASTALGSYDASGRITTAYDSAGRRYSYTYNAGPSSDRLAQVVVEVNDSGWVEVGRVEYTYYVDADDYGEDNDLETVKVTMPLSDSGVSSIREKLYRYYEGSYHATNNPGYEHQIEYIIDFEGYRAHDAQDGNMDDDPLGETEGNLKPYASMYFAYDTSRRISSAWFNGQCGCSGSANGEYAFTYETNGSYTNTQAYETVWASRTIVDMPDVTYLTSAGSIDGYITQYFDELGQALSRVRTKLTPSDTSGGQKRWATYVVRDSSGMVTEIHSAANISSYTHSTETFTTESAAGLITAFSRFSSGDMTGMVEHRTHQKGTSGDAYLDSTVALTSSEIALTDFDVVRPFVSSQRAYTQEITSGTTGSHLTSYSYTFWTGDAVNMPKQITTTNPAVSSGENGSGSATSSKRYMREDGTMAFSESTEGIFTYTDYDEGRLVKRIVDAQTNHGSDFASGDDPNTDFGITETANGDRRITSYVYDDQGRSDEVTQSDGRVMKTYYSKLSDERLVTLRYNDYESTPKYYGPVSYSVTNHAGKGVARATVALTNNESTTALTGHVNEGSSDIIQAMLLGSVERLSVTLYNKSGTSVEETRSYFDIPGSGLGADGTNYDATTVVYDAQGRTARTEDATGTITRSVYDTLGRVVRRWIGTNDNGWEEGDSLGTSDMVKAAETEYDGGSDVGNSYVTTQTAYVEDSATDKRETTFEHDVRGRALLVTNPQAPHIFNKYDNLGRMIASGGFSDTTNIVVGTDDPTTESSNRVTLSQTFYDAMGRAWKSQHHEIDQSDGSDDDELTTENWYDEAGRIIKVRGGQVQKMFYDRQGRRTHAFTIAKLVSDSGYADADDVDNDIVFEERQTVYESTDSDNVLMTAVIMRHHDDLDDINGTQGALDTNADGDDFKYTAANINGRIQITVNEYDRLDRVEVTAQYGKEDDFDGDSWTAPGMWPAGVLHSEYTYNDDGSLLEVVGFDRMTTRYAYDDAGRKITEIRNYVNGTPSPPNGDDDVTTRWVYVDGLNTEIWVDLDGDGTKDLTGDEDEQDQVTTYAYGVTKGASAGDSNIGSGRLLESITDPDGGETEFAYNAQSQQIWKEDPAGNVIETDYDTAGRQTQRRVTTLAGGFDGAVRRIATSYNDRGMRELITQYDNAAVGSGSVVDEVKSSFDGWGNLTTFEQDHNSAVGAFGSVDDYEISYAYTTASGSAGRQTNRVTTMTMPGGNVITYTYAGSGGQLGSVPSRVTGMLDGGVTLALYDYLGSGMLVGTDMPEPDVYTRVHDGNGAGASYDKLDRHNRVTTSAWWKDLATDVAFYDLDITYEDTNIVVLEDNIWTGRDVDLDYDDLNRLTNAEEGTWGGSSISSTTREQKWPTLTQLGGWHDVQLDLDGNGSFGDSNEYDEDRSYNKTNELEEIDDGVATPIPMSHDANGNFGYDGANYDYEYDAFNRLVRIERHSDSAEIESFRYNGLGYRIVMGTTSSPEHLVYNEKWQMIALFDDTDTDPTEEFIHHGAGYDGRGGSSYIDSVILRDRDTTGNGTLDERYYYIQNWRADVVALITDTGQQVEGTRYTAYGVPFGGYAGDVNNDGDVTAADTTQIQTWIAGPTYDVRGDLDLDGDVDPTDKNTATNNIGTNVGWKNLTDIDVDNRRGYAGYEHDLVIQRKYSAYHVRNRVLNSTFGQWMQRDPLRFVDGWNQYAYGKESPMENVDPKGLFSIGGLLDSTDPSAIPGSGIYPEPGGCLQNDCSITKPRGARWEGAIGLAHCPGQGLDKEECIAAFNQMMSGFCNQAIKDWAIDCAPACHCDIAGVVFQIRPPLTIFPGFEQVNLCPACIIVLGPGFRFKCGFKEAFGTCVLKPPIPV